MIKIIVADDSSVFRSQIRKALSDVPNLKITGSAPNGKVALTLAEATRPNLFILDLEMPEMNGIETLQEIRKRKWNCKVLIFSSYTKKGSQQTIEALYHGADDFLLKPVNKEGPDQVPNLIRKELLPKILQFNFPTTDPTPIKKKIVTEIKPPSEMFPYPKKFINTFMPSVLVIGSSTGGPLVLEKIFKDLKSEALRIPILIVQHMPPLFTKTLADRLQTISGVPTGEGKDWEIVKPGRIYLAPGDFHMSLAKVNNDVSIRLNQRPPHLSVRPAVDFLFNSAADIFKGGTLGIVLTGMGEDGLIGSENIKKSGGGIVIQSKESCTVFGMPGAVYEKKLYDEIADIERIKQIIYSLVKAK